MRCTATDARGQVGTCGFAVSVSRLPTLTATRFLAFGDSVTYGIIATQNPAGDPFYLLRDAGPAAYPSVLGQLLAGRYVTQAPVVVNAGRGGEKAVDGVGRLAGAIDTHRPDILLLLDGYNDLGLGEAGVAPGLSAVNDMVKIARFRGVRVFLATLTPPNHQATRGLSNALISDFNDGIRAIARGENVVVVDLYGAMQADSNRYNSDDQRHPNEAGYRKMAETFFDVIRTELEAR
ncbi:MAG: SGNH/GDSL hydrolase family protein [Vicinamibacterales bacterium]